MEEKLRFVFEHELQERTMTELCDRYEITRQTGYVWLRRYREAGAAGLLEHSRAAHRHHNQMPEEIEQQVLELRQAHMRWGPRKLKRILERDEPGRNWPAASTIGALLQREGLVVPRRKRVRTAPYSAPLAHADGPNRVWCADFKGWFRTADGERIDPLTISDAHSRYLLRCQAVEKTDTARVQAIFEAAFREYGMPAAIPPITARRLRPERWPGCRGWRYGGSSLASCRSASQQGIRSRMADTNACIAR